MWHLKTVYFRIICLRFPLAKCYSPLGFYRITLSLQHTASKSCFVPSRKKKDWQNELETEKPTFCVCLKHRENIYQRSLKLVLTLKNSLVFQEFCLCKFQWCVFHVWIFLNKSTEIWFIGVFPSMVMDTANQAMQFCP